MEYRLVSTSKGVIDVYKEEDSEKIGTITRHRHLLFFSKYIVKLNDTEILVKPDLLTRRRWTVGDVKIVLRWRLMGKGMSIRFAEVEFRASDFKNGKLVFKERERGRTGLLINTRALRREDHVLIEHYDRFDLPVSLVASALAMKRYNVSGW